MADKLKKETVEHLVYVTKENLGLEFTYDEIKDIVYDLYSMMVIDDSTLNKPNIILNKTDFGMLRKELDEKFEEVDEEVKELHTEWYGDK